MYIARLKGNVNEWVPFACDGTGPTEESKRTKRVQGWSRQNWLGGILSIVFLYIQPQQIVNALFARMLHYQLGARFYTNDFS